MKNYKISYDFQTFSLQKQGGISKYFCQLISKLKSNNQDIEILGKSSSNFHLRGLFGDEFLSGKEYNFPFSRTYYFNQNFKHVRKGLINLDSDILHPTYYHPYLFKNEIKIPIVITVHDFIHERHPEFNKDDFAALHKKECLSKVDGIICISENTKKDLLKFYPNTDPKKIKVVHHGIERKSISTKANHENYVLFIGNRSGYKNFELLKKCFEENDLKTHIKLVGGEPLNSIEKKWQIDLKNKGVLVSHSYPNEKELDQLYAKAKALIYPSKYEGFGMPILEAFSNACPVICGKNSSLPEVAGDAAIYIDHDNSDELYEAIIALSNQEKNLSMQQKGIDRIDKFTWEKTAKETLDFYQMIIAKNDTVVKSNL